jgi:hypothetical protein
MSIAGAALGMLGGAAAAGSQNRNQRRLMNMQYQNQRLLNQQGSDLQYDMWKKTNFPAQVAMMKEAGLNPALMYKGAGPGGTTGSQGGGAASGGNAAQVRMMDMQNLLLGAQKANLDKDLEFKDKQIDDIQSQINARDGYQRDESGSRVKVNIADAGLKEAGIKLSEGQLNKVNTEIAKIKVDTEMAEKIIKLDYSGDYGKNLFENVSRALDLTPDKDGALGLDDAGKIAVAVGSLALLRNPGAATKIVKPVAQKAASAAGRLIGGLMNLYRKVTGKRTKVSYD